MHIDEAPIIINEHRWKMNGNRLKSMKNNENQWTSMANQWKSKNINENQWKNYENQWTSINNQWKSMNVNEKSININKKQMNLNINETRWKINDQCNQWANQLFLTCHASPIFDCLRPNCLLRYGFKRSALNSSTLYLAGAQVTSEELM